MLDMLMFSVIFMVVQIVGGFIMMKLIMSKNFIKKCTKQMIEVMKDLEEDLEDLI